MNWLAHLYLSESSAAFRVGNLLPDLLPAGELVRLPPEFQPGVEQHRRIDAFTDAHPIVRRAIVRISPAYRRFGGVLVDLFFDHYLARDWPRYSPTPLTEFAAEMYRCFDAVKAATPPQAWITLEKMRQGDWLSSYGDIAGIASALRRIDARLRRSAHLGAAVAELEHHYADLDADFRAFFPELQRFLTAPDRPSQPAASTL